MRLPTPLLLLVASLGFAAPAQRVVLTDFEAGIDGWWTNPWGGGEITATAAPGRFGGGLRAEYKRVDGVVKGSLVSPVYPAEAAWREQEWGAISLWYRSQDPEALATLQLGRLTAEGEEEQTFSVPLRPSAAWRRVVFRPREMWSRQNDRLDLARLGRLIFQSSRPMTLEIDQIELLAPAREVPLLPYHDTFRLLEFGPQAFGVETPEGDWDITLTTPAGSAEGRHQGGGESPWLSLSLPPLPPTDGTGLLLARREGQEQRFEFPVLGPVQPVEVAPLGVFPTPQRLRVTDGAWRLPATVTGRGAGPAAQRCLDALGRGLQRHRLELEGAVGSGRPSAQWLAFGEVEPLPPPADLAAEGYTLTVTAAGAGIAARDDRGLFYGTLSLLQLIDRASLPGRPVTAPAVEVIDWPALPVRAASLALPTARWGHPNNPPVTVEFFLNFLDQMIIRRKYNLVVLLGGNAMQLESFPNVAASNAWTPAQMRRVVDHLRANFVEPVPSFNSLGHGSWLLVAYPEFADRKAERDKETGQPRIVPDRQTFDTRNPAAWEALMKVYDEVLEVFQPKIFHLGLDEVRWQTDGIPPELRGPRDTIDDRADALAAWVNRLHDHLAARGVETMIWTDMLTAEHNGGAPYRTARVLDRIPRDTWMVNWSSTLAPLHTYELRSLGFERVLEGNSDGVNRERGRYLAGNMVGVWSKVPWLGETVGEVNGYDHQMLVHGAEYSWRLHPEVTEPKPRTTPEFMRQIAEVEAVRALAPEPAAGSGVTALAGGGAIDTAGWFVDAPAPLRVLDLRVPLWRSGLGPGESVAVGRRAAALYLAQVADVEGEALTALRDELKDPAWVAGRPIGRVIVEYAGGATEALDLTFGWDVRPRQPSALPAAYAALGHEIYPAPGGGATAVYLRQWVNPHPERVIQRLTLQSTETPARSVLVGAAVREVAEG